MRQTDLERQKLGKANKMDCFIYKSFPNKLLCQYLIISQINSNALLCMHCRRLCLWNIDQCCQRSAEYPAGCQGSGWDGRYHWNHYCDVIMAEIASQITSLTVVYLTVYSDQRKHKSSASLAFVRGIHRWPVNSPHKGPVTRKMFPFDDVIMIQYDNGITGTVCSRLHTIGAPLLVG